MAKVVRINHVSYMVEDVEKAVRFMEDCLGGNFMFKVKSVESQYVGACTALGENIVSFLGATNNDSFVSKLLKSKGEGIQHIGLEIDNLEEFVENLEKKGIKVDKTHLYDKEYPEALVGAKDGYGVVLQLMQWKRGPMDTTPEGYERLKKKYEITAGLEFVG